MAWHEILQRRRQNRAGEGRHQPDAQVAGDQAGEAARLLVGVFKPADRLDAALVVALPRRRRHDAARRALEQLDPERALDGGDMLRDARLGGVLARGGARERAFLADRDHGADLAERDVGHGLPLSGKLMPEPRIYYFRGREHKASILPTIRMPRTQRTSFTWEGSWARQISALPVWIGSSASTGTG